MGSRYLYGDNLAPIFPDAKFDEDMRTSQYDNVYQQPQHAPEMYRQASYPSQNMNNVSRNNSSKQHELPQYHDKQRQDEYFSPRGYYLDGFKRDTHNEIPRVSSPRHITPPPPRHTYSEGSHRRRIQDTERYQSDRLPLSPRAGGVQEFNEVGSSHRRRIQDLERYQSDLLPLSPRAGRVQEFNQVADAPLYSSAPSARGRASGSENQFRNANLPRKANYMETSSDLGGHNRYCEIPRNAKYVETSSDFGDCKRYPQASSNRKPVESLSHNDDYYRNSQKFRDERRQDFGDYNRYPQVSSNRKPFETSSHNDDYYRYNQTSRDERRQDRGNYNRYPQASSNRKPIETSSHNDDYYRYSQTLRDERRQNPYRGGTHGIQENDAYERYGHHPPNQRRFRSGEIQGPPYSPQYQMKGYAHTTRSPENHKFRFNGEIQGQPYSPHYQMNDYAHSTHSPLLPRKNLDKNTKKENKSRFSVIKVKAPKNLPEGYQFDVMVNGKEVNATVPPGGVSMGEIFPVTITKQVQGKKIVQQGTSVVQSGTNVVQQGTNNTQQDENIVQVKGIPVAICTSGAKAPKSLG